jgi:glutamate synthase (NADPH/NADH) small chain
MVANPTGFMEHKREEAGYRPIDERVRDYREVDLPLLDQQVRVQSTRCMDCGIPFCHGIGCPVKNRIPEFNDLVRQGRWQAAIENLHSTNNFPEFTGRVCPAPCEPACTLTINDDAVAIKQIERAIVEKAWAEGWIQPQPAKRDTGRKVAIVGSGPAGLAAAQQLARAGHSVTVFERSDRIGGLLRYGIPDFKLDKHVVDRRLDQMREEGIEFQAGVNVGVDISARYLRQMFDATLLAMGATVPRDIPVPGRDKAGNIHFAMDYLTQQNKLNAGDDLNGNGRIDANGKRVVVIGGGDTGSDCIGTAIRQGAKEVHQFELLDMPPDQVDPLVTWPLWPQIKRTSSSHQEGALRDWGVNTTNFQVENGLATALNAARVKWIHSQGKFKMEEMPEQQFSLPVDLVLIAAGFLHVERTGWWRSSIWNWMRGAGLRFRVIKPARRGSLPRAMRFAGRRWWCTRSTWVARRPRAVHQYLRG